MSWPRPGPGRPPDPALTKRREHVARLYREGFYSLREIAMIYQVSHETIRTDVRVSGEKLRPRGDWSKNRKNRGAK